MCDHCGCRSFPPIAELTAEHDELLRLAWELVEAVRLGNPPSATTQRDLLALLELHGTKEETGLFPALVATGDLSPATVADLEDEHRQFRRNLAAATLDRRDYYALAAHIELEEMELFPAAMFGFDDEEWDATEDAHRAAGDRGALSMR